MDGNSNYQSLQAKLEHRWKNGLVISAAYTFSKLLDDVDEVADSNSRAYRQGVQNVYDLRAEWGIGFAANYVYSLPFGRGGKYGADTSVLRDIVGGWELSGITDSGSARNATPQCLRESGVVQWTDLGPLVQHCYLPGSAGLHSRPGINNWDLAHQQSPGCPGN
jgi:hypothetical protein